MIYGCYTSDHHTNSARGLFPPRVKLDDGGIKEQNEYQFTLWKYWIDFCDRFNKIQGSKFFVLNGDLFDLDTLGEQRITDNPADILKIAESAFEPLLSSQATYMFVCRGTDVHNGKVNWLEEAFAQRIGAQRNPDDGNYSWWHLRQNIEGVPVNTAHHINIGQKPWTEDAPLLSRIYEIMINESKSGYEIPRLCFRGHVHTPKDTGDINPMMRIVVTPSWQGKTVYAYKRATDKPTYHGGTIVKFYDGKFDVQNVIYQPKKESVWTL